MTIHIPGDNQQIFDRVCAHLAGQGRVSKVKRRTSTGTRCKYQTGELRCAIGGLLPDDAPFAYLDRLKDSSIGKIIERGIIAADADPALLTDLQAAHDNSYVVDSLRQLLRDAATKFGLSAAAVDQITVWEA